VLIQIDTREHKSELKRIEPQFDAIGVEYFHKKLDVGDYADVDNLALCIDRKKDLLEVCTNITQQHERFTNELNRALESGTKLIILIEHGKDVKCLGDVYNWHNPRLDKYEYTMENGRPKRAKMFPKATDGPQLYKSLRTIQDKYHVDIKFCDKDETGYIIYKLLGGD